MREYGCRTWVRWGGERSRGKESVSRRGECQSEHSKVATAQVILDRDSVLVDDVVDTNNFLISRLPDDAIDSFVGK